MIHKIHCPGCQVSLQVPLRTIGCWVRCPACRHRFQVPKPEELVEETISTWIEEDLEQEFQLRREKSPTLAPTPESEAQAVGQLSSSGQAAALSGGAGALSSSSVKEPVLHGLTKQFWKIRTALADSLLQPVGSGDAAAATARPISASETGPATSAGSAAIASPVIVTSSSASYPKPAASLTEKAFPTMEETRARLAGSPAQCPVLAVRQCTLNGVTLEFDQDALMSVAFRMSMPVRDVFGGQAERSKLLARPLVFVDRSDAAYRAPADLESRLEQQAGLFADAGEILAAMGNLPQLPTPFNLPMVYYVDPAHHEHSLTPSTHKQSDTEYRVQLRIADGPCALAWLHHVNGCCGPEYAQLESELNLMRSDGWFSLSEICRQRLSVWCDMRPRERFLAYVNDIDFGQHDAGLAGMVVTDQRVIYRKNHHHGQIDLSQAGTLRFKRQEGFLLVVHEVEGAGPSVKLIRMAEVHFPKLMDVLTNRGQLRLAGPA